MRWRLLVIALCLNSTAKAQFLSPVGRGANGQVTFWTGISTVSSDGSFLWDNLTKILTVIGTISATSFTGTHSEFNIGGYTATHGSATGLHTQGTIVYASTIVAGVFVVDTTGSGGGSMTMKLCDDSTSCAAGHIYVTCTTSCAAAPGTVTNCSINKAAVAASTTLSWVETAACGTNDLGGNMNAHLTNP